MVSRLPVVSGKTLGSRVEPEKVLPVVLIAVGLIVLLISYPWHVLATVSLLYLASLPFGWISWQRHVERAYAAAPPQPGPELDSPVAGERPPAAEAERPARLN
jgi:CDP-diacylglycerol--serine O-phosphatidyltransferase